METKKKQPRNEEKVAFISSQKANFHAEAGEKKFLKALLIEDNQLIQQVHCKYLMNLYYSVEIASTQQKALEYVSLKRYDLILTDLGLPDNKMDGSIIKYLRKTSPLNYNTPLIVVAAYANLELKTCCLAAGASEILIKPLIKEQLEEILEKLCIRVSVH